MRSIPKLLLLAFSALPLACQGAGRGASTAPRAPAPETRELAERDFPIDVERYSLELTLDPVERSLVGRERVRFVTRRAGLGQVAFDLVGLDVSGVQDEHGAPLGFRHEQGRLTVEFTRALALGEARELSIDYSGRPERGLWYAAERDGLPTQVFTQGECEDARAWFACIDHPAERAASEIVVRMPRAWRAMCGGERLSREEQGETAIERWRMHFPHPSYLETLCAGEFVERTVVWDNIPLHYLAAPRLEPLLETSFGETMPILSFLSRLTGQRYPFGKYAQVCVANFPFGGMENASATTLTETALVDERGEPDGSMAGLIAHEAAHQWFGDLVTCADWSEAWLNEGLATYCGALYTAESQGADAFDLALRDMRAAHVGANQGAGRRAIVWKRCVEPLDLFLNGHVYGGAAVRLHLLRGLLGDPAFFSGLQRYLAENAGRSVRTADLRQALERASGRDLTRFFEQWFLAPGHPELSVGWTWDAGARQVLVSVEQRQRVEGGTPAAYELPAEIELRIGSELRRERVELARRRHLFAFACAERPRWVRFDPQGWIPMELEEQRSDPEWLDLAQDAAQAPTRAGALDVLAERLGQGSAALTRDELLDALVARAQAESVGRLRARALRALAGAREDRARAVLVHAAEQDAEAIVRSAALEALAELGEDVELAALAERAFEHGPSWGVRAAAARLAARADPARAYETLERAMLAPSPEDVLAARVVGALVETGDPRGREQALAIASDERRAAGLRAAAVAALGGIGSRDREVQGALAGLLEDRSWPVRRSAIAALGSLGDARSLRALEARWPRAELVQERRAIEAAFPRPKPLPGPDAARAPRGG